MKYGIEAKYRFEEAIKFHTLNGVLRQKHTCLGKMHGSCTALFPEKSIAFPTVAIIKIHDSISFDYTNRSVGSPDLFASGVPNNHHTAIQ
jgi:hypothetical protein